MKDKTALEAFRCPWFSSLVGYSTQENAKGPSHPAALAGERHEFQALGATAIVNTSSSHNRPYNP